jgi:hypothetical protein
MTLLAVAYARIQAAQAMASAANNFLASLYPEQREKATFKIDDDERFNWFYTPVRRKGLPPRDMTSGQRQLALALLSAGLSQQRSWPRRVHGHKFAEGVRRKPRSPELTLPPQRRQ